MTPESTKIIIAGAGLGGLTAAGCLLQAGFDVEVYEQAAELGEIGAGVQQSANATHVMRHLGILDQLRAVASRPPVTQFRIFNTGDTSASWSHKPRWNPSVRSSSAELRTWLSVNRSTMIIGLR